MNSSTVVPKQTAQPEVKVTVKNNPPQETKVTPPTQIASTATPSQQRSEIKPNAFGSFEQQTPQTPVYFAGNPLNKAKAQWLLAQCGAAQTFKFLTGKDTDPCGRSERPAEACENCQRIQPIFMRLEWTREIPAADVAGLGPLLNQTFPLPDGCRLLVFTSEQEAKTSPWNTAPFVHGAMYVYVNQQGQQAVCFAVCKCCRRFELKPIAGQDQSLFCRKGDAYKAPVVKKEDEVKQIRAITQSSRSYGRPDPCRFIFNESTFPVDVRLPAAVLMRKDSQGQVSYLKADDIVCFFDDVLMPFRIQNNTIIIEVQRNPFEKLYRPKEYDNLAITVAVYRRGGRVPTPGLNLAALMGQVRANVETKNEAPQGSQSEDIIYKSTFRYYMHSPELGDGASDSESDEDEQAIPKGVVAKRRYHMADHLQLAMTFKGQESFYTVIQGYLRGGFFAGTQQDRLNEKSKRNALFTEVMKQDVPAARKYVADMLVEVGEYYLSHCRQEPDFREGLLQLLDFAHSLGSFGLAAFQTILGKSPFVNANKPIGFRFPRKFGADVRNVLVTAAPDGSISELVEGDPSTANQRQGSADDDLSADFEIPAFAKLSITDEPTAYDRLQQSQEARVARFAPATGLYGGQQTAASFGGIKGGSSELKDGDNDPPVNPNVGMISAEDKSLNQQVSDMDHAVAHYPTPFKVDKESKTNLLKAVHVAGYMCPMDGNNAPVTEITKSYWQAGLNWSIALWPFDLSQKIQGEINETKFVTIMGGWLNSKEYAGFCVNYTRNLHVSHLRKLFRLYTNELAPASQLDPSKPRRLMDPVEFVQCVLLMLMPNNMQRPDHRVLAHHGPLDLGCAIDCIYDALCEPKTEAWLQLYRGAKSRIGLEATWRATKATEKKGEEVPFFLRLPEIRVEGSVAYGLNLLMCFEKKNEFTHLMLCVDVFDDQNNCASRLLDAQGQPQKNLGDWTLSLISLASGGPASGRKARYMPRIRYKGPPTLTSE